MSYIRGWRYIATKTFSRPSIKANESSYTANELHEVRVASKQVAGLDYPINSGSFLDGRPRIPHSAIVAMAGWSTTGPTAAVEVLDPYRNRWTRPEPNLSSIADRPRAYHGIVTTGDAIYCIGGFNGQEYHRGTRKFDLHSKV